AKNDEAISLLETAIKNGMRSLDAYAALGSLLRRAGRFQRAIEAHEAVVKAAPALATGYLLVGDDHYAMGEWDKAVEQYERGLARDSSSPVIRHWMARALAQRARQRAEQNRTSDAVRDLRRAFDLEHSAVIGRALGAALLTQRDYRE